MEKVAMIGTLECQEGEGEAMERVLEDMVRAASSEPSCEVYSYYRGEGNTFWFFALMTDHESMQKHGQGDAMKAAMAAFRPLMAGPPKMSTCRPIAALGLDL